MRNSILLSALLMIGLATPTLAEEEAEPKHALSRLGVIGASVSAGYGTEIEFSDVLGAGIKLEHGKIHGRALKRLKTIDFKAALARLVSKGSLVVEDGFVRRS